MRNQNKGFGDRCDVLQAGVKEVFQRSPAFVAHFSDQLCSGSIPEVSTEFFAVFFSNEMTYDPLAQPGLCIQFFNKLIAHPKYPFAGQTYGLLSIRCATHDELFIIAQYVPIASTAIDNFRNKFRYIILSIRYVRLVFLQSE